MNKQGSCFQPGWLGVLERYASTTLQRPSGFRSTLNLPIEKTVLSLSEAGLSHAISLQESLLLHIPAAMHGLIKAEHQLLMSMMRFTVVLVLLLISVRFSLIHLQTPDSKLPPLLEGWND